MSIDRLVQIANELKTLDHHRAKLLTELERIAGGLSGGVAAAPRRGHLSRSSVVPTVAPSRAELVVSRRRRKKGLTTAIVDLLQGNGAAYTAGDVVRDLKLPKTKSQIASVSTTLVRLAKEGRVAKDEERGYVAN
jgi:hypothetical protein